MPALVSELESKGMVVPSEATQNLSQIKRVMRRSENSKVVVVVFDGIGSTQLRRAGGTRFATEEMDSLIPSLTIPFFASVYNGGQPASHGVSGIRQPLQGKEELVDTRFSDAFPPNTFFREVDERSGLTVVFPFFVKWLARWRERVHVAGTEGIETKGYAVLGDMPSVVRREIGREGVGCVFAYYPFTDAAFHLFGDNSLVANKLVRKAMRTVEEIYEDSKRRGFEVYATSDHGQMVMDKAEEIAIKRNDWILEKAKLWGSPRMRFVRSLNGRDVEVSLAERFGNSATIIKSEEALSKGMFGLKDDARTARKSFGDYVLIPSANGSIYLEEEGLRHWRTEHGGLAHDEAKVPFISCQRA